MDKYQDDMTKFRVYQSMAKKDAENNKSTNEAKVAEMNKKLEENWKARTLEAKEKYADWDEAVTKSKRVFERYPREVGRQCLYLKPPGWYLMCFTTWPRIPPNAHALWLWLWSIRHSSWHSLSLICPGKSSR